MRTKDVVLGCSIALLFLAYGREASSGKSEKRERRGSGVCTAVQVSSPDATTAAKKRRARTAPTFSASEILDLQLQVLIAPGAKEPHQVELRVFTPNGHLYQSLSATSSAAAAKKDGERRDHRQVATAVLPVAGTTIVNSSLYGEWRVEAYVDGERETPCAKPQPFVIEP